MKMQVSVVSRTFKPFVGHELPELVCEKGSITELEDYIEYLKFEVSLRITAQLLSI